MARSAPPSEMSRRLPELSHQLIQSRRPRRQLRIRQSRQSLIRRVVHLMNIRLRLIHIQNARRNHTRPPLLATFVVSIFVSAALLFAVQPLFTKMVLPQLGGAAAVWSVALVFFQTALLAGYAYAHLITRLAPGRTSLVIHILVNAVACLFLPLHIASNFGPPPQSGEAFWLLALFTVSIGLPFFALAANGPLLRGPLPQAGGD